MSNVLDLVDQTIFRVRRAAGLTSLIQCAWTYDRPADIAGLRRFHRHLQHGRLSRRIERSHCRSAATAGSPQAINPSWRSSRHHGRVKNSTHGWPSRPTLRWMSSTDPDGTSRCCRSPTGAAG